jgi:hypothetical protein
MKFVIAEVGKIGKNGIGFTEKCLKDVAEQIKELPHGVLDRNPESAKARLEDIAFTIDAVEFDGKKLEVEITPMDTPCGEIVNSLIIYEAIGKGPKRRLFLDLVGIYHPQRDAIHFGDKVMMIRKFNCHCVVLCIGDFEKGNNDGSE